MLSRASQTSRSSKIIIPEGIYPLQEYSSDLQTHPQDKFPKLENEDHQDQNNKSSELASDGEKTEEADDFGYSSLMPFNDFEEMFNRFFVTEHKKLMMIQAKIRGSSDFDQNPFRKLAELNLKHSLALRNHCYQLQMILYKSPRGRKYDAAL